MNLLNSKQDQRNWITAQVINVAVWRAVAAYAYSFFFYFGLPANPTLT